MDLRCSDTVVVYFNRSDGSPAVVVPAEGRGEGHASRSSAGDVYRPLMTSSYGSCSSPLPSMATRLEPPDVIGEAFFYLKTPRSIPKKTLSFSVRTAAKEGRRHQSPSIRWMVALPALYGTVWKNANHFVFSLFTRPTAIVKAVWSRQSQRT